MPKSVVFWVSTAPAPTTEYRQRCNPGRIMALAPINTSLSITTSPTTKGNLLSDKSWDPLQI